MEALGINLGYLITFALSFGILFVVLRAWVYKPLLAQLETRRLAIAQGLEDARIAADARANAEKEANRIITDAQTQSAELIREATDRASKVEHEVRAQAEADVVKARETALAEIDGERNRMLSELRGQIVTLALAAAQKLLVENLDERRQHALVNEFFSGVRNGSVTVLDTNSLAENESQAAEITSALPLTEEEQTTVKKELLEKLGGTATISFRVDPSILGGLVVRVGDRIVDGSVSGRLEDLRQTLH